MAQHREALGALAELRTAWQRPIVSSHSSARCTRNGHKRHDARLPGPWSCPPCTPPVDSSATGNASVHSVARENEGTACASTQLAQAHSLQAPPLGQAGWQQRYWKPCARGMRAHIHVSLRTRANLLSRLRWQPLPVNCPRAPAHERKPYTSASTRPHMPVSPRSCFRNLLRRPAPPADPQARTPSELQLRRPCPLGSWCRMRESAGASHAGFCAERTQRNPTPADTSTPMQLESVQHGRAGQPDVASNTSTVAP
jgi:hypothetical protein